MATTFCFVVSFTNPGLKPEKIESLLDEAHRMVSSLEDEMTEFRPISPVFKLNEAKPFEKIACSSNLIEVLNLAQKISLQTEFAFDVTAKSSAPCPPGTLIWDSHEKRVWKTQPHCHLGLGAIGKGFALDCVAAFLESEGVENFRLDAGGSSLIFSGKPDPESQWSLGWSWKKDSDGKPLGFALRVPDGPRFSVGVSGVEEKGAHILSGHAPTVANKSLSAFVGGTQVSAAAADALSTALFVLGWNKGHPLIERIKPGVATAVIEAEKPQWNGRFLELLEKPLLLLWIGLVAGLGQLGSAIADDEAVDLGDLGLDSFNPYTFERNTWLILLPLAFLALVALHLRKRSRSRNR